MHETSPTSNFGGTVPQSLKSPPLSVRDIVQVVSVCDEAQSLSSGA